MGYINSRLGRQNKKMYGKRGKFWMLTCKQDQKLCFNNGRIIVFLLDVKKNKNTIRLLLLRHSFWNLFASQHSKLIFFQHCFFPILCGRFSIIYRWDCYRTRSSVVLYYYTFRLKMLSRTLIEIVILFRSTANTAVLLILSGCLVYLCIVFWYFYYR